jgi:DNA-binding HxlR family transcriptional regulator
MSSHKNALPGAYPRAARPDPLADCPLNAMFAAVGGKWKLTIVYWLAREEHHFSGLLRRIYPISHKVLTEHLRELEADGIVARLPQGPVPAPVIYQLTAYGRTVLPLVERARVWGMAHLDRIRGTRVASPSPLSCSGAIEDEPAISRR